MYTAWRPESRCVEVGNGALLYLYNSPDRLWRIRCCEFRSRGHGVAGLSLANVVRLLEHHADGRAQLIDVGLFLQTCTELPHDWRHRVFNSAQEAIDFVERQLARHY